MTEWVVVQRLLFTTLLAGIIGYERERHGRAAGFRTHILVGIGACLVMMTGIYLMESLAGTVAVDPTRMAAQVISGIGFLGAGTIIRFRASVVGLTTAASLWAVAGIGLAVGSGFLWGGSTAAVVVIVILYGFSRIERSIRRGWYRTLVVEAPGGADALTQIRRVLAAYDVEIRDFDIKEGDRAGLSHVELNLKLHNQEQQEEILSNLLHIQGVGRAHWV